MICKHNYTQFKLIKVIAVLLENENSLEKIHIKEARLRLVEKILYVLICRVRSNIMSSFKEVTESDFLRFSIIFGGVFFAIPYFFWITKYLSGISESFSKLRLALKFKLRNFSKTLFW